ncbi:50S ribosomal protein L25 [Buchnera aphidicola (Ceratovacuna keduensis)]|uniref:50S ribosomal protein L25 n=1 Tax=Buchnera aphidicola TaxID=9 RepID=UPI0031B8246F
MKIIIKAHYRNNLGTRNSKRLRKQNKYPCILYSVKKKSIPIYLKINQILKLKFLEDIYKKNIIIYLNKIKYLVKILEIQRHVFKNEILHIDFFLLKIL